MANVKSAFEKAMEKIQAIDITPEEKEELRDREKIRSVLAAFYRGELKRDDIWEKLKGIRLELLTELQQAIADSLRLSATSEEFQMRKDGILAIEAVKGQKNAAAVENVLSGLNKVQREYREAKERAIAEVRRAVEENPRMRLRPVRTADGRVAQATLSVEEAISERLAEFLPGHEKQYEALFAKAIERLKKELR